jgi:cell division protein FtsB
MSRPTQIVLVATLVVLGLAVWSAADAHGLRRFRKLETDIAAREEQNHALAAENEQLQREIQALQGDPRAVERAAREELGLVREGEVVFTF